MELSIPYVLTAPRRPDGPATPERFVIGNSDAAKADPDWIGTLDPDNGITGLLDGGDVRAGAATPLAAADGIELGRSFRGGRSGTVQGRLDPNVPVATREAYETKARAALYAMRHADGELSWTPSAGGPERMIRVRTVARPDFRGRHPKTFLFTFASPDDVVVSRAVQSLALANSAFNPATLLYEGATNLGNAESWPWMRIDGPAALNQFFNYATSGRSYLRTKGTTLIADAEFLLLYPARGIILRGSKTLWDFEPAGLSGWGGNTGVETVERDTTQARGGVASLAVATNGAGANRGAFVAHPVKAGRSYHVYAWVRGFVGGEQLTLTVGGTQPTVAQATVTANSGFWQRVALTFTATRNETIAIAITTNTNAGFNIDEVSADLATVDDSGEMNLDTATYHGPFPLIPGTNLVQWDATGTSWRTPEAQVFWRHAWH